MRLVLRFLAAPAALLAAGPAFADMTARYRVGEVAVTSQVSERGDARTEVTDAAYLTRDGTDYLVVRDAGGDYVVRLDDFTTLLGDLVAASRPAGPAARIAIVEAGTETVGGRSGVRYRVYDEGRPDDAFEAVVATDTELAPLARAQARHFGQMIEAATAATPGVGAALRQLMERGVLLRMAQVWRLESVSEGPLATSLFELPSAPISRSELERRLGVPANP